MPFRYPGGGWWTCQRQGRRVEEIETSVEAPGAEESHEVIYPAIIEYMRDGVLAIDGTGNIISINSPALDILKLRSSDLMGQNFAEVVLARRDLDDLSDSMIDAIYAPNNVLTRDVVMKDGNDEKHLVIRTSMLMDKERHEALGVVAIISDVSEKVQALRERIEFGHLVVLFITVLGLANIVTLVVGEYLKVDVYSPTFGWAYLFLISAPVFVTVYRLGLPLRSIGLTLRNWRQAVIEGGAVSALTVGMLYILSEIRGPMPPIIGAIDYSSATGIGMIVLLYGPHSFVQELLSRGVLQGSLGRLLNDQSGFRSLLTSSLMFGMFHSHFGLPAVVVTGVSGLIFGYLFMRHKNLIGATMAHVAGGTTAFALHFM